MDKKQKELIIIGSGPAAYTASIYASRYKVDHMIIGSMPGGTITSAHKVCNYPGFDEISGMDLMMKVREQVNSYEVDEVMSKVIRVDRGKDGLFSVHAENGGVFVSKSILIAVGTKRRNLGLPSESRLEGKGISYCCTCDGMFYKDKVVGVIGGANAANMAAIYLADIARKVYVIYRKGELRGDRLWIDEVLSNGKIELVLNSNVVEFLGDDVLTGVRIDKDDQEIALDGAFLEIGSVPSLDFDTGVELTEDKYIKVDGAQKTSIDGIYAAGDITDASDGFHQVITACSEGAIAAHSIYYWLKSL